MFGSIGRGRAAKPRQARTAPVDTDRRLAPAAPPSERRRAPPSAASAPPREARSSAGDPATPRLLPAGRRWRRGCGHVDSLEVRGRRAAVSGRWWRPSRAVQDGASLAGNESSEASLTTSVASQPYSVRVWSMRRRADAMSWRPIAARTASTVPAVASRPPPKPPRRAPSTVRTDTHRRGHPPLAVVARQRFGEARFVPYVAITAVHGQVLRSITHVARLRKAPSPRVRGRPARRVHKACPPSSAGRPVIDEETARRESGVGGVAVAG